MIVVVAPDSFKGSASATEAASAIAAGWSSVRPGDEVVQLPQADGGEGTLDAVAAAVPDARAHSAEVTGPDGRRVVARWLALSDGTAVVELAQSSGLPQMERLDPVGASTDGLGEVIAAAIAAGATSLVIGLGGSASTDGGAGALRALGMRLLDDARRPVRDLERLASIDASALIAPPSGGVRLLTDVRSPLLGPEGAAAVFGPQKGADAAQIETLERGLERWAALLGGEPRAPGAGAAGGTAYGLAAAWGAVLEPGAEALSRLSGLPQAAARADVLILGEGRFDETSTRGKVVGHALTLAAPTTRAVIVAGAIASPVPRAGAAADRIALTDLAGSSEAALADAPRWLREAGAEAARRVSST